MTAPEPLTRADTARGAVRPDPGPLREVYVDRAHLAALAATHPALSAHLTHDPNGAPGLATVLVLQGQTGQVTFHIADADTELFEHVPVGRG
jgi:hypothetical protein